MQKTVIMKYNKFISFEGIDGSGKTTQIELIGERLSLLGENVVVLREPGGTLISERIREILLDKNNLNPHFIAVTPKNPLILECINTYVYFNINKPYSYLGWSITYIMYNILKKYLNIKNFKEIIYKKEDQIIQLSQEICPYGGKNNVSLGKCYIKQGEDILMYNRDEKIYNPRSHNFK